MTQAKVEYKLALKGYKEWQSRMRERIEAAPANVRQAVKADMEAFDYFWELNLTDKAYQHNAPAVTLVDLGLKHLVKVYGTMYSILDSSELVSAARTVVHQLKKTPTKVGKIAIM
jgi:hypothetical protein